MSCLIHTRTPSLYGRLDSLRIDLVKFCWDKSKLPSVYLSYERRIAL